MDAKEIIQKIDETLYQVYNPEEEKEEREVYHRETHRGKYDGKDLRNMFIGSLRYNKGDVQSLIDGIREAIDKMPDEWVAEFLKVINGDVVEPIKESATDDSELVNEVDALLNANNLYYCVSDAEDGVVSIEVEGDWKHDHLYLNQFMQQHGFTFEGEDSVEDNGTDFYYSIHSFKKAKNDKYLKETMDDSVNYKYDSHLTPKKQVVAMAKACGLNIKFSDIVLYEMSGGEKNYSGSYDAVDSVLFQDASTGNEYKIRYYRWEDKLKFEQVSEGNTVGYYLCKSRYSKTGYFNRKYEKVLDVFKRNREYDKDYELWRIDANSANMTGDYLKDLSYLIDLLEQGKGSKLN